MNMFGKIAILALGLLVFIVVSSCGETEKTHDQDRLTYSFRNESPEMQQHVATILAEAKEQKYQTAMNKLALLSATRTLTHEQNNAVEILVKQLRYDMEEEIFQQQSQQE